MITLVLTYRNRTINIIKKCLDSLKCQSNTEFTVTLVNYGSEQVYTEALELLIKSYSFINYINCSTSKQLWNKAKAINIALKQCENSHFFVADADMMFRNDFIDKLHSLKDESNITYFQVGFLNEGESLKNKEFDNFKIKHISSKEATGMTLYSTQLLKEINGYDEFYHGWGSEDTDVHVRLQHAGYKINFYTKDILILHQWHERTYRTEKSKEPFHTSLEQINQQYLHQTIKSRIIKVNINFEWGKIIEKESFNNSEVITITITNLKSEVDALLMGNLKISPNKKLEIHIIKHSSYKSVKNGLKQVMGIKFFKHYSFQEVNNLVLAAIITNYRNNYYEYEWNNQLQTILLKIAL